MPLLSKPQFPHNVNADNNNGYLAGLDVRVK